MRSRKIMSSAAALAMGIALVATAVGAENPKKAAAPSTKDGAAAAPAKPPKPVIEPRAVEILRGMSAKLASARSMKFTAVATYESPSRYGAPLAYTTSSEVLLKRGDKLAVITTADGPANEFYYDGKSMTDFSPADNVAARAVAPPTIDAMLKALYDAAGTYFPFTDVIVADPFADMAKNMTLAFYIGQSKVVGGEPTDMVAYESDGVFVQMWIGAEDKLPRMARAVYFDDPLRLRHQVEMRDWKLDSRISDDDFVSKEAAKATPAVFEHPSARKAPAQTAPLPVDKNLKPMPKPNAASK